MSYYLDSVDHLYITSYNALSDVFHGSFNSSEEFKQMVLVMNQNMIEYRFLSQAGLIKD